MRHLCYVRICFCAVSTKVENVALCEQSEQLDQRLQIPAQPVCGHPICMSTLFPAAYVRSRAHDRLMHRNAASGAPMHVQIVHMAFEQSVKTQAAAAHGHLPASWAASSRKRAAAATLVRP